MSTERLGLFDTPPDRQEVRLGLLLVVLLFVTLLIFSAVPEAQLRPVPAFIPMVDAVMFLGDMVTATLLYTQASVFRSRALAILASGFLFEALMLVAHVLTFPGAFAPNGLLGAQLNTTAWIGNFWRAAPPIAIILYVLRKRTEAERAVAELPQVNIAAAVLAAVTLAIAVTTLTTAGHDLLPQMFWNQRDLDFANARIAYGILITLLIVALAALYANRKSVLDLWLLVALAGWLAHALLNIQATARFTLSFYTQFGMLFFSHFVVMLALIAETNRLYARLALSTAARNRERDARMMAMDAVTASFAHEVGQPLAAVGLHTSGAIGWLSRAKPDVEKALIALREVSDAGRRTFDIITSIRATFAKEPGQVTEFNLNDLVVETAALLDLELATNKISLQLSLDDSLPPFRGDRVQMQRVLVNLITNAIESLRTTPNRSRHIAIRTALLDDRDLLLQVIDTGAGIEPEECEHIFDAFYTTKATGTGLGLPLCRTIIEEHGGRIWASPGEQDGAIFHMRLPRSGALAVVSEVAEQLLTNLEDSLRLLRQSKSGDLTDMIAELQHVIDEVRGSMRESER